MIRPVEACPIETIPLFRFSRPYLEPVGRDVAGGDFQGEDRTVDHGRLSRLVQE